MGRLIGVGLRILVIAAVVGGWNHNGLVAQDAGRIRPYEKNPRYWQYKGQPLLLLGGTDDDNLFQWTGSRLTGQLDLLKSIGGNYIRCTVSARDDGNVQPFAQVDGKYDLTQWNDEYWNRFERLLKLTRERDIIVQIEVWAFHDFNAGKWETSPWRPASNVNYTLSNTTLKDSHGNIGRTAHDFFFTVPKLADDRVVLRLQQSFVDKMLSYTLRYGHVLYCMTNEIHPQYSPEWGWYWSSYVKEKAAAADTRVETTEMYWEIDLKKPQQRASLDRPEVLSFFEASQNSAKMGQENWNNLRFAYDYLAKRPRPINHVKIYGADSSTWKGSTDRHATECFWRNIIGGSASSRFHRPPYGLGLGKKAQTHIRSMRMLTDGMDLFTCAPHNELLSDREPNEAYCLADPGKRYAVYFPNGGEAVLDIGLLKEPATIRWLEISTSKWGKRQELKPARSVTLRSPESGPWVALLVEGTVLSRSSGEYVTEVKRVAFGGCGAERFGEGSVQVPTFASVPRNGQSRARVVVRANPDAAGTRAWHMAMANPAVWRQANDSGTQSSGNGNASSAQTIQAPYPSSPVVRAMRLDWSTHKRFAQGSDNFQLTWVDDDHLYGAWGDGGGFGGTNEDGRVSLGVARVEGPWNDYSGYNVWGGKHAEHPAQFKGKSWGMICIKGVLYMWVVPDYSTDGTRDIWHYSEARLAKSTDHGAHWTKANWAFFESDKLIIPTICNFGKHYAGARDNYVYHYFVCPQDNLPPCDRKRVAESLIAHKPGRIYLARVDQDKIFDSRDDYEFFIGFDKNGLPKWGSVSAKQPVFEDKRGTGWCMSASYNPGLGRYILCTEHTESCKGNLGVFDAPEPWGPWTTVEYVDGWGKGHIERNTFFWSYPTKWLSEDGREFTLGFTGAGSGRNNDSFNTVRGKFILSSRSSQRHIR